MEGMDVGEDMLVQLMFSCVRLMRAVRAYSARGVCVQCARCVRTVRAVCAYSARGVCVQCARCVRTVRAVCAYSARGVCVQRARCVRTVRGACTQCARHGSRLCVRVCIVLKILKACRC